MTTPLTFTTPSIKALASPNPCAFPYYAIDPTLSWADATANGTVSFHRGFETGVTVNNPNGGNIGRHPDRHFFGMAADQFAGDSLAADGGNCWFSNSANGPAYLGINAQVLCVSYGKYAIAGASRASDSVTNDSMGGGFFAWADSANSHAWAGYFEAQITGGKQGWGQEIAVKNASGVAHKTTPYTVDQGGGIGTQYSGGADNAVGPAANAPSDAAIVVVANAQPWQSARVVKAGALVGSDGSATATGQGWADRFARTYGIRWDAPLDGFLGASINSFVTSSLFSTSLRFSDNQIQLIGPGGVSVASFLHQSGGCNFLQFYDAPTGSGPLIFAAGVDANIDIPIVPKGAGRVRFGALQSVSDTPISGYIEIKDAGGVVRKLAVIS